MTTLPWKSTGTPATESEIVVLASRLRLQSVRQVPGFLRAALAIRRQLQRSEGALGVSLIAQPSKRTFWTLSAWTDDDAITRFVGEEPHRTTMSRYRGSLEHSDFVTWSATTASLPGGIGTAATLWDDGRRRIAAATSR